MFARLAVLISIAMSAGAFALGDDARSDDTHLPKPVSVYVEQSEAGVPVRLNYSVSSLGSGIVFLIGSHDQPAEHLPSLDEQGRILDHLLERLFEEHPDQPATFSFFLGESRESLIELLDQKLRAPRSDWDPKRGRPQHGQFGIVLKTELEDILLASPIAKAFQAHGYTLKLDGIGRIDIEPIKELGGGRFPKYIDIMNIRVAKIASKG